MAEYRNAQAARKEEIRNEDKRIEPELDATAMKAETVDTLSGPMFQRPGTTLFTVIMKFASRSTGFTGIRQKSSARSLPKN